MASSSSRHIVGDFLLRISRILIVVILSVGNYVLMSFDAQEVMWECDDVGLSRLWFLIKLKSDFRWKSKHKISSAHEIVAKVAFSFLNNFFCNRQQLEVFLLDSRIQLDKRIQFTWQLMTTSSRHSFNGYKVSQKNARFEVDCDKTWNPIEVDWRHWLPIQETYEDYACGLRCKWNVSHGTNGLEMQENGFLRQVIDNVGLG